MLNRIYLYVRNELGEENQVLWDVYLWNALVHCTYTYNYTKYYRLALSTRAQWDFSVKMEYRQW